MRRTTAAASIIGMSALLALGTSLPASAHNYVVSSTPAEGETIAALPDGFVLTTNEPMLAPEGAAGAETAGFAIQVTDAAGLYYGDGCLEVAGTTMGMGAGLGEAGDYTLTYQFISADGHTVSESYGFSYAPAGDSAVQTGLAEPPVCGEAAVTGEALAEPAPSEVPDASAEPEATDEAATPAPSDDAAAPEASDVDETGVVLGIVGGVLALLLIAGIVTAIVLRRRGAGAGSTPVD